MMKGIQDSSDQDSDSVSSFSSDDSSYKEKFEREKEKNLKLREKLQGFQSVANQTLKFANDNKQLRQKLDKLKGKEQNRLSRQPSVCRCGSGDEKQVLSELHEGRTKNQSESSSSFEVLQQSFFQQTNLCSTPKTLNRNAVELQSNKVTNMEPEQKHKQTTMLQNATTSSEIQNQDSTVESPLPGHDAWTLLSQASLGRQTIPESVSSSSPQPMSENFLPLAQTSSPPGNGSGMSVSLAARASSIQDAAGLRTQHPDKPSAGHNLANFPTFQYEATLLATGQETSTGGPQVSVPFIPHHQRQTGTSEAHGTPPPVSTCVNVWGIGARPKDTNPLDWSPLHTMTRQTSKTVSGLPNMSVSSESADVKEPPLLSGLTSPLVTNVPNYDLLNFKRNSDVLALNIPNNRTSQCTTQRQDDLMTFPDVKTPLPEKRQAAEGPFVKQSNQVVACPSDDQEHQLASQAHSMVVQLRNSSFPPAAMSDMLFRFAEEAAQMEKKFMEYQSQIQRQQVQIQSYAQKNNNDEELKQLRFENEHLTALLKNQLGVSSSEKVQSEKQQSAIDSSSAEMNKKIEDLTHTNEQLFKANKDWHTRWQSLQQNAQRDKLTQDKQISSLTKQVETLRAELGGLEKHVEEANAAKQKSIKKALDLEQEKLNLNRDLETVKAKQDDLLRLKRKYETEITSLKARDNNEEKKSNTPAAPTAEVELLKQQLAVFHEDFQKEREDRSKAEGKVKKMRKERDAVRSEQATKMKKLQALLASRDNDLKRREKQIYEMQLQITNLKKELQKEKKKSTEAAKNLRASQQMLSNTNTMRSAFSGSVPNEEGRCHTYPPIGGSSQLSPEHLPNAWQCRECTFINFPERSVCDICGWQNDNAELQSGDLNPVTGIPELKSRGEYMLEPRTDEPDVVTD